MTAMINAAAMMIFQRPVFLGEFIAAAPPATSGVDSVFAPQLGQVSSPFKGAPHFPQKGIFFPPYKSTGIDDIQLLPITRSNIAEFFDKILL